MDKYFEKARFFKHCHAGRWDREMKKALLLALLFGVAWLISLPFGRKRKRLLQSYWSRNCTGSEWRSEFPTDNKDAIRDFLEAFTDGFAFSSKKRLKFGPNDKVMDLYRALYPEPGWADSLELETFSANLEDKYGLDLENVDDHDITLGRLFEMTRNPNNQIQNIGTNAPNSDL